MTRSPSLLVLCLMFGLAACGNGDARADTDNGTTTPPTADAQAAELTPAAPVPNQEPIPYPPSLFAARVEGEVMLYLVIDSTGRVIHDSTRIETSSGHTAFDAAALQAAPSLRFTPARLGDSAVTAPIQVPIRFILPDSLRPAGPA